jgi:hypothetical protein
MDFSDDPSLVMGTSSRAAMPRTGRSFAGLDPNGHTEFDSVSGDDTSRTLPQTSRILVAKQYDDSQQDLRTGDLLFVNQAHKSTTNRFVVKNLCGVNAELRAAAYEYERGRTADDLATQLAAHGGAGGGGGGPASKRAFSDALLGKGKGGDDSDSWSTSRHEFADSREDRYALTVKECAEKWKYLGVMCADISPGSSDERLIEYQWGGRVKLPYIVQNVQVGMRIGLEYYVATLVNRTVYTGRGVPKEGQSVARAIQIRLISLGSATAASQFASGVHTKGGGAQPALVPRALTIETVPTVLNTLQDWSPKALTSGSGGAKRSSAIARAPASTVVLRDAPLESSFTVCVGRVDVLPFELPSVADCNFAQLVSRKYREFVNNRYMLVTPVPQRIWL